MAHTKVLLTENIPGLGAEADVVRIRRGYARNFLIPQNKALELDKSALRRVNHLKIKRAEREARELAAAEELAARLGRLSLKFELALGESGKAFGSVTAKDIHDRLLSEVEGLVLDQHAVKLEKAIKDTGVHSVEVQIHQDVVANVKVSIPKPPKVEEEADAEDSEGSPRRKPRAPRKPRSEEAASE